MSNDRALNNQEMWQRKNLPPIIWLTSQGNLVKVEIPKLKGTSI